MKFKIAGILVILLAAYLGAKSFVGDPFSSAKWQITTEGQSRQRDDSSCGLLKITPRDARSLLKERFSLEISEGMLVSGLSIHFADHKNDEYCNGFRKIAAHQDVPTPTSAQLRYNTRFPASTPIGSLVIHPGRGGLISKSAGISWDCEGDAGICHAWMSCMQLRDLPKGPGPETIARWEAMPPRLTSEIAKICPAKIQEQVFTKQAHNQ